MIDLHCHILPGIDDGAPTIDVSLDMAKAFVDDGVTVVACTPHILPGMYHNSGPQICQDVQYLQEVFDQHGLALRLVEGADNHIVPDFIAALRNGQLLSLAGTRYVLVEPPHHTPPPRLEEFFFELSAAGYVPILTHPERLSWITSHYPAIERLFQAGVWMQITAGSLTGAFGKAAKYWAERMLDEGRVHILATDAHDMQRRRPNLSRGRDLAAARIGALEAEHLVVTRPRGVIGNVAPIDLPNPMALSQSGFVNARRSGRGRDQRPDSKGANHLTRLADRLRHFFG